MSQMTRSEVHHELTLLGVSSEVHQLVDDLDLAFGHPPRWMILRALRKDYPLFPKHVYKSRPAHIYIQGQLF